MNWLKKFFETLAQIIPVVESSSRLIPAVEFGLFRVVWLVITSYSLWRLLVWACTAN